MAPQQKRKRSALVQNVDVAEMGACDLNLSAMTELDSGSHVAWLNFAHSNGDRISSWDLGEARLIRLEHQANPQKGPPRTAVSFVVETKSNACRNVNKLVSALAGLPQLSSAKNVVAPFRDDQESGSLYLNCNVYDGAKQPLLVKNSKGRVVDLLSLSTGSIVSLEKVAINCVTLYTNNDDELTLSVKANPKFIRVVQANDGMSKSERKQIGKAQTLSVADMLKDN